MTTKTISRRQTIDQRRAKHALETATKVKGGKSALEEFVKDCKRAAVQLRTCGLGTTVAYMLGKKRAPELLKGLAGWLHTYKLTRMDTPEKLIDAFVHSSVAECRHMTQEALAYVQWVVRLAEALEKSAHHG